MGVSDRLSRVVVPKTAKKRLTPVWAGPESDAPNGGVTYSLLSRFLVCRERFRCLVVEGLKPTDSFSSRIEFGSMWHVMEESLAGGEGLTWENSLTSYAEKLWQRYPSQRPDINHWVEMAAALFPVYVDYWSKHPDVTSRVPLLQEQSFKVPYRLPSGRIVYLRGKWDSVDLIRKGTVGVYLQENKTKSSIDAVKLTRQLAFDLQTMLYLIALKESRIGYGEHGYLNFGGVQPVRGVRYNVIRRSAHKSVESMLKKVHEDVANGRGGEWFSRFKVEVSAADVERFRRECLDPILENLCNWWHSTTGKVYTQKDHDNLLFGAHWRHPFGVYNVLDEGGSSDLDAYLESGSEAGLTRVDNLFPELS